MGDIGRWELDDALAALKTNRGLGVIPTSIISGLNLAESIG